MARLSSGSALHGLRGHLGKELVFKQYGSKTVVSKYPDMSSVKPSVRQLAQRAVFKEAMLFASLVCRHPELRAFYAEGLLPGESLFRLVKKEYLIRLAVQ